MPHLEIAVAFPLGHHLESLVTFPADPAYVALELILTRVIRGESCLLVAQQPQALLRVGYTILICPRFLITSVKA